MSIISPGHLTIVMSQEYGNPKYATLSVIVILVKNKDYEYALSCFSQRL